MLLTGRELEWQICEEMARDCIRVLARTKPIETTRSIRREGYEASPCSWTSSRWARFIKWCLAKKYLSRLVPYPLVCLACATEIHTGLKTVQWPDEVVSCILAQVAQIRMEGREPKCIAVGVAKHEEIMVAWHLSTLPIQQGDVDVVGTFYGLPLIVTQKLTENSVLVL